MPIEFFHQPAEYIRLGDYLNENFKEPWTEFRAAVAFAKRSGVRHIENGLAAFAHEHKVDILVGIDHGGTSSEGLRSLLDSVSPTGTVSLFHSPDFRTFHPKMYLFKSATSAELLVGSGNLTEGGLFANYEAGLQIRLDLTDPTQAQVLQDIEEKLDDWGDTTTGTTRLLDYCLLDKLTASGFTPLENAASSTVSSFSPIQHDGADQKLFAARVEPRTPSPPSRPISQIIVHNSPSAPSSPKPLGFLMTLQQTDVGVGQKTTGTSRRSPEIFIPLTARNRHPEFWGWQDKFTEDPSRANKYDRLGVKVRLEGADIEVNMMTWPVKHDFRIRSEALRSAGNVGDILRIERGGPSSTYEYCIEIIPKGTTQYSGFLALCTNRVPSPKSQKIYGYY